MKYVYRVLLRLLPLLLCVSKLLLLLQQQCCCFLLFPAVSCCHRELDGNSRWQFNESDPSVCFLFIRTRTPWQYYCRFYGLDLPTSSAIASMRGAKAGVSPPRRSPACIEDSSKTSLRGHLEVS